MKLTLKKRDLSGKHVKTLRSQGLIPANFYGPKTKSQNVVVDTKQFYKVFQEAGYNNLVDVEVEGSSKTSKMLIKEVQSDPIKSTFLHVSFYAVDMDQIITTEIPVKIVGESTAVKKNIGILVTPVDVLTVRCLPADLPREITMNIDDLNEIGDNLKVSDITLPENVEFTHDISSDMTIVYIAPPQKKIVEEKPEEEPEGEEGEEGEETVEKKEGEESQEGGESKGKE